MARRTRKWTTPPSATVTSWRTTSAIRRSRTDFAAVSTALRAAAAHDSLLTPITSVTRYTLSAMRPPRLWDSCGNLDGFQYVRVHGLALALDAHRPERLGLRA